MRYKLYIGDPQGNLHLVADDVESYFYDAGPEDECPVCQNGTLEKNEEGELVCRGECGAVLQQACREDLFADVEAVLKQVKKARGQEPT